MSDVVWTYLFMYRTSVIWYAIWIFFCSIFVSFVVVGYPLVSP